MTQSDDRSNGSKEPENTSLEVLTFFSNQESYDGLREKYQQKSADLNLEQRKLEEHLLPALKSEYQKKCAKGLGVKFLPLLDDELSNYSNQKIQASVHRKNIKHLYLCKNNILCYLLIGLGPDPEEKVCWRDVKPVQQAFNREILKKNNQTVEEYLNQNISFEMLRTIYCHTGHAVFNFLKKEYRYYVKIAALPEDTATNTVEYALYQVCLDDSRGDEDPYSSEILHIQNLSQSSYVVMQNNCYYVSWRNFQLKKIGVVLQVGMEIFQGREGWALLTQVEHSQLRNGGILYDQSWTGGWLCSSQYKPIVQTGLGNFFDARDIAAAHVKACEQKRAELARRLPRSGPAKNAEQWGQTVLQYLKNCSSYPINNSNVSLSVGELLSLEHNLSDFLDYLKSEDLNFPLTTDKPLWRGRPKDLLGYLGLSQSWFFNLFKSSSPVEWVIQKEATIPLLLALTVENTSMVKNILALKGNILTEVKSGMTVLHYVLEVASRQQTKLSKGGLPWIKEVFSTLKEQSLEEIRTDSSVVEYYAIHGSIDKYKKVLDKYLISIINLLTNLVIPVENLSNIENSWHIFHITWRVCSAIWECCTTKVYQSKKVLTLYCGLYQLLAVSPDVFGKKLLNIRAPFFSYSLIQHVRPAIEDLKSNWANFQKDRECVITLLAQLKPQVDEAHESSNHWREEMLRGEKRGEIDREWARAENVRRVEADERAKKEAENAAKQAARAEQEAARAEQEAARAEQEAKRAKREAERAEKTEREVEELKRQLGQSVKSPFLFPYASDESGEKEPLLPSSPRLG